MRANYIPIKTDGYKAADKYRLHRVRNKKSGQLVSIDNLPSLITQKELLSLIGISTSAFNKRKQKLSVPGFDVVIGNKTKRYSKDRALQIIGIFNGENIES